jgi:hypothetical protein
MTTISISVFAVAVLVAALFAIVRSFGAARGDLPLNTDWIDELSVDRYRPMMRLLDDSDLEFLRSQPGFTPRMASRLRARRSQVFRGYLRRLSADFHRVCTAVKVLMLQSKRDRPDLAAVLVRQQALFALGMAMVQARLFLYRWDLCTVDVRALVQTFDVMRLELRNMLPATVGAAA